MTQSEQIAMVLTTLNQLGLSNISPRILSDEGHLILYLSPYPLITRVGEPLIQHSLESCQDQMVRELKVARHLASRDIPVVSRASFVSPGPHFTGNTWMTLWDYAVPTPLPGLTAQKIMNLIWDLTKAMADFDEPLPRLKGWHAALEASKSLCSTKIARQDHRIKELLMLIDITNDRMEALPVVFPAHGDAHHGNLLQTTHGWLWNDFEDASLMPRYWDLASFLGNTALLEGLSHPTLKYAFHQVEDPSALRFALTARGVMATTTNLAFALRGRGDLDFAKLQLARIHHYYKELTNM